MMNSLKLESPIRHNGQTITELHFRRARAGDFVKVERLRKERGLSEGQLNEASTIALSVITDQPEDIINLLDVDDFLAATELANDFLSPRRKPDPSKSAE